MLSWWRTSKNEDFVRGFLGFSLFEYYMDENKMKKILSSPLETKGSLNMVS